MGYTFIDLPWRSINFSDNTDAFGGLLDIFSLVDEPAVVDDRANLAAPESTTMQSLLSGAAQAPDGTLPITSANATTIATTYNTSFFQANGTPTSTNLQANITTPSLPMSAAQLPNFLSTLGASSGLNSAKNHGSPSSAPWEGHPARTWNILVDVVAQVGRLVRRRRP